MAPDEPNSHFKLETKFENANAEHTESSVSKEQVRRLRLDNGERLSSFAMLTRDPHHHLNQTNASKSLQCSMTFTSLDPIYNLHLPSTISLISLLSSANMVNAFPLKVSQTLKSRSCSSHFAQSHLLVVMTSRCTYLKMPGPGYSVGLQIASTTL